MSISNETNPHRARYALTWRVDHQRQETSVISSEPVTAHQYGTLPELPEFITFWQWQPGDVKQFVASFPTRDVRAIVAVSPDDISTLPDDEQQNFADAWSTTSTIADDEVPF